MAIDGDERLMLMADRVTNVCKFRNAKHFCLFQSYKQGKKGVYRTTLAAKVI